MMNLYQEAPDAGNEYRVEIHSQLTHLMNTRREQARARRTTYFKPNCNTVAGYERSTATYREDFIDLLGWPLNTGVTQLPPEVHEHQIAEDDACRIFRIWVRTLPGLDTYGLLLLPKQDVPAPLLISQHGGGGTPELCTVVGDTANYNNMSRRALRKGFAVFAPQLPMWRDDFGPALKRDELDQQLKHLGGSMAALDVFQIQRCLDALISRPEIDPDRIGMMGLSWGGFYTLVTAAVETRIKAALSSCFFNDRDVYPLAAGTWFNSANQFHDLQVAALICPRPLCLEIGAEDELFRAEPARPEAEEVQHIYESLGLGKHFHFIEHAGGHEFNPDDTGLDFLWQWLSA